MSYEVVKIGGTSMTNMSAVLAWISNQQRGDQRTNFVVSAFGAGEINGQIIPRGVTDLLVGEKKGDHEGVYNTFIHCGHYAEHLAQVSEELKRINALLVCFGLPLDTANRFIDTEIISAYSYLAAIEATDLSVRNDLAWKRLASIGETHSAFALTQILRESGYDAEFVDLSGYEDHTAGILTTREIIQRKVSQCNDSSIRIVTGYSGGSDFSIDEVGRGYSEVTAAELVIHLNTTLLILKEFNLSSADPRIVDNPKVIDFVSVWLAAELSMVGMEAVHPKVARLLQENGIELVVKKLTDVDDDGTIFHATDREYKPAVQIIAGAEKVVMIKFQKSGASTEAGYLGQVCSRLSAVNILSIASDNSGVTVVIHEKEIQKIEDSTPQPNLGDISITKEQSLVVVSGSNLEVDRLLYTINLALSSSNIPVHLLSSPSNPKSIQIVVDRSQYTHCIQTLHTLFFPEN